MASNVWSTLKLPVLYLTLLLLSLYTVCSMYRRRQAAKHISVPWFTSNMQRDIFLSLKHTESADGQDHHSRPPQSLLRAALLRWAAEVVRRALVIHKAKQAREALLSKGSIGCDISKRIDHASQELDQEGRDVADEANALASNSDWAETIFQSANEIIANGELRKRLQYIEEKKVEECGWWGKRQATIIDELLREFGPETVATLKRDVGGGGDRAGSKKKGKSKN